MTFTAKVAVCSEIRKKQSMQGERLVEFWTLSLAVRQETARL